MRYKACIVYKCNDVAFVKSEGRGGGGGGGGDDENFDSHTCPIWTICLIVGCRLRYLCNLNDNKARYYMKIEQSPLQLSIFRSLISASLNSNRASHHLTVTVRCKKLSAYAYFQHRHCKSWWWHFFGWQTVLTSCESVYEMSVSRVCTWMWVWEYFMGRLGCMGGHIDEEWRTICEMQCVHAVWEDGEDVVVVYS